MRYLPAFILDVVLVMIFAAIGRASHEQNPAEFLLTAWPFLVALVGGHLIALLLPGRPRRPWSPLWGAVVWIVTVTGGMLLRIAAGDTAAVPFIIVATLTLGLFLVGWRLLTALLRRRASRASSRSLNEDSEADRDESLSFRAAEPVEAPSSRVAEPVEAPEVPGSPNDPDDLPPRSA